MWRCVNYLFGYCKTRPVFTKQPHINNDETALGGKCKYNYKTCKRRLTCSEEVK